LKKEYAFEGKVSAVSTPDLLTFIGMLKKNGVLTIDDGKVIRKIFWEKGEIVFANSTHPDESLGSFLVRHGKITQEQNMKSGLLVEPGKRQGKILVQMGVLTPKQLWWAVKNQVLEIIYKIFSLTDGKFYFEEIDELAEEKIKLSTSTTNIIMEGIRRLDELPRIKELIPDDKVVPTLVPEEFRDNSVKFEAGEIEIMNLVDGERNIREIIHISPFEEFETLRILMALLLARYIYIPGSSVPTSEEEIEDAIALENVINLYNEIYSKIWDALGEKISPKERQNLFDDVKNSLNEQVLEGPLFDARGQLPSSVLMANVADYPQNERHRILSMALENLLSFILFEASKHLDSAQKDIIYKLVEKKSEAIN
jgi:hypothetical protein